MSIQNNSQLPYFSLVSHSFNNFHPYDHSQELQSSMKPLSQNINHQYYEEFKKLYFTSYCISLQFDKIIYIQIQLNQKINKLEKKLQEQTKNQSSEIYDDKPKRFRRKADLIQRKFYCQAERCGRNYGSEGSLQQHIKLKHPQLYKKGQLQDQSL